MLMMLTVVIAVAILAVLNIEITNKYTFDLFLLLWHLKSLPAPSSTLCIHVACQHQSVLTKRERNP